MFTSTPDDALRKLVNSSAHGIVTVKKLCTKLAINNHEFKCRETRHTLGPIEEGTNGRIKYNHELHKIYGKPTIRVPILINLRNLQVHYERPIFRQVLDKKTAWAVMGLISAIQKTTAGYLILTKILFYNRYRATLLFNHADSGGLFVLICYILFKI